MRTLKLGNGYLIVEGLACISPFPFGRFRLSYLYFPLVSLASPFPFGPFSKWRVSDSRGTVAGIFFSFSNTDGSMIAAVCRLKYMILSETFLFLYPCRGV